MPETQIQKILDLQCICGHPFIKHAEYVGLGCGLCDECSGWEKLCTCDIKILMRAGCQCR
jgi:hypothetical protein